MKELIAFELRKLLHKALALASLISLGILTTIMTLNWLSPGSFGVQEDVNGRKVSLEGRSAILRNQEIAAQYQGPLTTEKVQRILEEYTFSPDMMAKEKIEPENQYYYIHNSLYDALTRHFARPDCSYNGADIRDVFGEIAPDLTIGYSAGWEYMIYILIYDFMTWSCILVIILSPVFSEEYTKRTDALILTGIQGRKKCPAAKIIASYIVSLGGSLILIAIHFLLLLAWHGTEGFEASIQLGNLGLFSSTPYVISWGKAFALSCVLWLGAAAVLTALVLLISVWAKSSFSALVISFTLFMLPMFLPRATSPTPANLAVALMPINQIQVFKWLSFDRLSAGGIQVNAIWLSIPVALIAMAVTAKLTKKFFVRHQVTG